MEARGRAASLPSSYTTRWDTTSLNPMLPAQIHDRDPGLMLLQNANDLIFSEPALAHRPSPLDGS
jgi:hypothetical protein